MNPRRLKPFIKAFQDQQKSEADRIDFIAWLNGIYEMRAIGAATSGKVQYFEKPIGQEEHAEQANDNDEAALIGFSAFAAEFNKQFSKER